MFDNAKYNYYLHMVQDIRGYRKTNPWLAEECFKEVQEYINSITNPAWNEDVVCTFNMILNR